MKNFVIYFAQIFAVAVVGYLLWIYLYGKPDVPFKAWLLICIAAALLGLISYGLVALIGMKRRKSKLK